MQNRAFTLYIIHQKFDQINSLAIEKKKMYCKSIEPVQILQNNARVTKY